MCMQKITRSVYFDILSIYYGSEVAISKMVRDLPPKDWTPKQAIAFLLSVEREHFSIDGCIGNAETWSLIFDLKTVLNASKTKITERTILDLSRIMTDISNYFSTEEDGRSHSDLFLSLFGMFLRKKQRSEETPTIAETSLLVISTVTFLYIAEKFYHKSIEYEARQVLSSSLQGENVNDKITKNPKACELIITNLPIHSKSGEM